MPGGVSVARAPAVARVAAVRASVRGAPQQEAEERPSAQDEEEDDEAGIVIRPRRVRGWSALAACVRTVLLSSLERVPGRVRVEDRLRTAGPGDVPDLSTDRAEGLFDRPHSTTLAVTGVPDGNRRGAHDLSALAVEEHLPESSARVDEDAPATGAAAGHREEQDDPAPRLIGATHAPRAVDLVRILHGLETLEVMHDDDRRLNAGQPLVGTDLVLEALRLIRGEEVDVVVEPLCRVCGCARERRGDPREEDEADGDERTECATEAARPHAITASPRELPGARERWARRRSAGSAGSG